MAMRENKAVEDRLFGKKTKLYPWLNVRKIPIPPSGKSKPKPSGKSKTDTNVLQKPMFAKPKLPQNCWVGDMSPTCGEDGVTRIHQKPDKALMEDMYHQMWNVNCLEKTEERQYEKRKIRKLPKCKKRYVKKVGQEEEEVVEQEEEQEEDELEKKYKIRYDKVFSRYLKVV